MAPRAREVSGPPRRVSALLALAAGIVGASSACDSEPTADEIRIGLLLSYTGYLAANASNCERAVLMAIEAANQAGGLEGRPIRVVAGNTRSDPLKALKSARRLLDAGSVLLIGPDYGDVTANLQDTLEGQTVILPSFATFDYIQYKPHSWFVMGPGPKRFACELLAQAKADGRRNPVQIVSPNNFNATLAWELSLDYGIPKHAISISQVSTVATVRPLADALAINDAYLLAASPDVAAALIFGLTAIGAIEDPKRWYLSPTLHTPTFFDLIPRGSMIGARGVAPDTIAGSDDFRALFSARWGEAARDEAYPFYDAAAVAVLGLRRALREEHSIPTGTGLATHMRAVTKAGATPVRWNEIGRGLELLREGREVEYIGLKGPLQFDSIGRTQVSATKWWTIGEHGVLDMPRVPECEQ